MAFLSPKVFVPFVGGYLLDTFQVYGKHVDIQFLGYFIVFGIAVVFFVIGACVVWGIKEVKK